MMLRWEERPTEVANLLNPAFVGILLRRAVDGYAQHSQKGMPLELLFLVLPFCLHAATARRLPRAVSTPLHVWLQRAENRDVLISFAERASALVPFGREAIMFAAQRGVLAIEESGLLRAGDAGLLGCRRIEIRARRCAKPSDRPSL